MVAKSKGRIVVVAIAFGAPAIFLSSCKDNSSAERSVTVVTTPSATVAAEASSVSIAALSPLDSNWLVRLPLDGFGNAVVAAPTGATLPRPRCVLDIKGLQALRHGSDSTGILANVVAWLQREPAGRAATFLK